MPEGGRQKTCRQVVVAECGEEACELSSECGFGPTATAGGRRLGEDQQGGCGAKEHFTEAQVLGGAWKRKL